MNEVQDKNGLKDGASKNDDARGREATSETNATPREVELTLADEPLVLAEEERRRAAERRRRTVIVAVSATAIVAIIAVVVIWRLRGGAEASKEETEVVVSVRVAKAERAEIAARETALGTIFPRDTALVSPKISAQIRQMPLWKNRVVRAGDVLAVLESNDLQAQRNEAVAALNEARAAARSVETGTIPQNTAADEKALRDARAAC